MELHEIDALLADTSNRLGLEPPPDTPESLPVTAQPVSFREDSTGLRTRTYKRQADDYLGDVRDYLGKIRRGRSVRKVDPNQPAFSPHAETIRQVETVNRANLFERRAR